MRSINKPPCLKVRAREGTIFHGVIALARLANERDRIIHTINMKAHLSFLPACASLPVLQPILHLLDRSKDKSRIYCPDLLYFIKCA